MQRNEDDSATVIKAASRAVQALEPFMPKFNAAFKVNAECTNQLAATSSNFDSVGNILGALGTTNLVSSDVDTKLRIRQGGEASKIISKVYKIER